MTGAPRPELSWVLPLYRTAAFVEELLRRIDAVSREAGITHEVIFVDDACPEASGAVAAKAACSRHDVRVLQLPRNIGQDSALREGLRRANGDWAVLLDADLQDPPEALGALWEARKPGIGALFAARQGRYSGPARRATSKLYRATIQVIGGLPRGACLYVLLDRAMIDAIAATRRSGLSLLAAIAAARRPMLSLPLERARREQGRSAYGHFMRARKAIGSLWQMFLGRRLGRAL